MRVGTVGQINRGTKPAVSSPRVRCRAVYGAETCQPFEPLLDSSCELAIITPMVISSARLLIPALGLSLLMSCGGPGATPTPVPTPTPILSVAKEDLPKMALPLSFIEAEFPGFQLDADGSGHLDHEDAADDTIEPDDTGADLAARGHLEGYKHDFSEPNVSLGARVSTRVELFATPALAQAFLTRQVQDFRRFIGIEFQEGSALTEFRELPAPDVGTDAVAVYLKASIANFEGGISNTFVAWLRGPVVARVRVLAFDDEDRVDAIRRLAQRMDERIVAVVAGEISALPATPAPPSSVEPQEGSEIALAQGFDLPAMLPTLADLPEGPRIESEGFLPETEALVSYERKFEPGDRAIELGSSQLTNIIVTVSLYASAAIARAPVESIASLTPEDLGERLALGVAEDTDSTGDAPVVELLELPALGDSIAGYRVAVSAQIAEFESYQVFMTRGRIRARLSVVGVAGQAHLQDVIFLIQLIDERIQENSP